MSRIYKDKDNKNLRKGLKEIHIGDNIWLTGRDTVVNNRKHQIIYGPDNKEYDLWDTDVDFINQDDDYYYSRVSRDGNKSIQSKAKIYILTHILDDKINWCFDLNKIPNKKMLKVVYENGTVRNINFDGVFKPELIGKYNINPFGYRI